MALPCTVSRANQSTVHTWRSPLIKEATCGMVQQQRGKARTVSSAASACLTAVIAVAAAVVVAAAAVAGTWEDPPSPTSLRDIFFFHPRKVSYENSSCTPPLLQSRDQSQTRNPVTSLASQSLDQSQARNSVTSLASQRLDQSQAKHPMKSLVSPSLKNWIEWNSGYRLWIWPD